MCQSSLGSVSQAAMRESLPCVMYNAACVVLQVIDCLLLLAFLIVQAGLINYFFIRQQDSSQLGYGWFAADVIVLATTVITLYLSAYRMDIVFPSVIRESFLMRLRVSNHGVLPYGFVIWLIYSLVLAAKIFVAAHVKALENLPQSGWFTCTTFQLYVGLSCPVFLFLLKTHRDQNLRITHTTVEYLTDLGSKVSLEILDTIDILGNVLCKHNEEMTLPLMATVLTVSAVNLVLPSVALLKLAIDDVEERGKPMSLYLLYSSVRVSCVDVPFLIIRGYIARVEETDVSLFVLKNVMNIVAECRYLVPAYIRSWRKKEGYPSSCDDSESAINRPRFSI